MEEISRHPQAQEQGPVPERPQPPSLLRPLRLRRPVRAGADPRPLAPPPPLRRPRPRQLLPPAFPPPAPLQSLQALGFPPGRHHLPVHQAAPHHPVPRHLLSAAGQERHLRAGAGMPAGRRQQHRLAPQAQAAADHGGTRRGPQAARDSADRRFLDGQGAAGRQARPGLGIHVPLVTLCR